MISKLMKESILIPLLVLFPIIALTQELQNSNFSEICESSKTHFCDWDLSWGKHSISVGNENGNSFLQIKGNAENSVGFVEQELLIKETKHLKILTISAVLTSRDVIGKGAGLNVGFYDTYGTLLSTKDMGGFYSIDWATGTTEWSDRYIRTICPIGTTSIKIGAILYGKGTAGFDNFTFSLRPIELEKANRLANYYVQEAIAVIKQHSLYRDSLDFDAISQTATSIAGKANTTSNVYVSIEYLLSELAEYGDHHSFFMKPEEVANWEVPRSDDTRIKLPTYRLIEEFGYIDVPPFHGGNKDLIQKYANELQSSIKNLDEQKVKGWIIDLRENTGGNMGPMIAGLGPLFSDYRLGSLVDIDGNHEHWSYKNGTYFWEKEELISFTSPVLVNTQLPIAVLTSGRTGSSGEAVVISFKGNLETTFFGEATWGLTTGNDGFDMSDGARIMLSSTKMVDRNGLVYSSSIMPDVLVYPHSSQEDLVLSTAIKWLDSKRK